jgi:hypothetical protein
MRFGLAGMGATARPDAQEDPRDQGTPKKSIQVCLKHAGSSLAPLIKLELA